LHRQERVVEGSLRRALRVGAGIIALLAGLWAVHEISQRGRLLPAGTSMLLGSSLLAGVRLRRTRLTVTEEPAPAQDNAGRSFVGLLPARWRSS
jgi:hypothetical protein